MAHLQRSITRIQDADDLTGPGTAPAGTVPVWDGAGGFALAAPAPDHYTHRQDLAASTWTVAHGLGRFPSVTVADSIGNVVVGNVDYVDANTVTLTFSVAFGGIAYLS